MKELIALLLDNEDWLVRRILSYAKQHDYTAYTSTLEEAWRLSISGLSASLVAGIEVFDRIPDFGPQDDFSSDPLTAFGVLEARKHRDRGVTLAMFLGLMKYYRQSYLDLLLEKPLPSRDGGENRTIIERSFDRIEIAFCQEWARTEHDDLIDQLRASARNMTNQKNAYLTVFESLSDPVILLNDQNEIINLNHAAARLMDPETHPGAAYYQAATFSTHRVAGDMAEEASSSPTGEHVLGAFPWLSEVIPKTPEEGGQHAWSECEALIDGLSRHFEVRYSSMLDVSEKFVAAILTLRDVTQRVEAERALVLREAALSAIFRAAPTGIGLLSSRRLAEVNDRMCEMLGYRPEELLGRDVRMLYPSEEEYRRAVCGGGNTTATSCTGTLEVRWVRKDGEEINVLLSSAPVDPTAPESGITFTALDITRRKGAEQRLRQYADTQATLLREVNHRVKNNLCAIMGMLHMELDRAEASPITPYADLLRELVSKVRGLATVHSLLSASEWRPLGLQQLCREVIKAALQGLPPGRMVDLDVTCAGVQLPSHQAQHLTLVLNELTTNTIKHALEGRDRARIEVRTRLEPGMLWLEYRDDGPGYPRDVLDSRLPKAAIGFGLIQGIVQKSLGGTVDFENRDGAVALIRFAPA